jgi:hypothetical protein
MDRHATRSAQAGRPSDREDNAARQAIIKINAKFFNLSELARGAACLSSGCRHRRSSLGNGASAAYTLWRTGTPGETDMMNGRMMDGWGMTLGPGLFCVLVLVLLVLGIVALVKYLRA